MDVTEIGNRIKRQRTALEMTQKDLAKEMNVSNQLISKWETGESVPSLEYLDALCKALKVDYSYFTSDSGNRDEKPESEQPASALPTKPKRQRKFKWNWKLFIIIAVSLFSAAFIAGFTVLTIYVFVPSANRKNYIREIDEAEARYFELGYYSLNAKIEVDGDVKDDYRYDGYFDENGNPAFYDTQSGKLVKGGIVTYDVNTGYKYHYYSETAYESLYDMAVDKFKPYGDDDEDLISHTAEEDIKYIRKIKNGYYFEVKDEFFTDELSGTQKKNYKLTDKIKGWAEVKDGLLSSVKITVKYLNKPDNEEFTISVILEYIAEKPVIEHSNLEEREWNGTYVDDRYYSPESSDLPDLPGIVRPVECDELLNAKDFISSLSGSKARSLEKDFDFNEKVLNGELKYGGDCYYYVDGNNVEILYQTDLSHKVTKVLLSSSGDIKYVYVYNGNIYYTVGSGFYVKNVSTGTTERLIYSTGLIYGSLTYNGKYAIYFGNIPDTYDIAYNVIDLSKGKVVNSYTDIDFKFMDSSANVYCMQRIGGKDVPVVYHNGKLTALKGKDFFSVSVGFRTKIYIDGDSICTYENDTVYRYEKGELKETLTSSDVRFMENYVKLSKGYCITDSGNIYDENGELRKFGTFNLKDENGQWVTVHDSSYSSPKRIIAAVNGKLIVLTDYFSRYLLIYNENDLSKPIGYMIMPDDYDGYCEFDEIEIRRVGTKTIIALRTSTADYYGYELYYFYTL